MPTDHASSMSPYFIHRVTTRTELDAVTKIIWAAMPGKDRSHPVFYPILDDPDDQGVGSEAARQSAIERTQARLWSEHESDEASNWIYVTDADTDADTDAGHDSTQNIIGGCQWRCYSSNPFPNGMPAIEALWWPVGIGRSFATEVVKQCYRPRTVVMARPHVGLSLMAVRPEHQRLGIGKLLMQWGIDRADSMGVEMFIEATPLGRELYSNFGFRDVANVSVDMTQVDPLMREGAEWQQLQRDILPVGYTAMWRPVKGAWEAGEPWETFGERLEGLKQHPSVTRLV